MHRPADDTQTLIPRPQPAAIVRPSLGVPRPTILLWPWALLAITTFGTVLRFYHLSFPALWNDETLVFWRVCGTYGQMLRPLSTDGFPPLHYSLYWLMGHPVPVEPLVVKSILGVVMMICLTGGTMALTALLGWPTWRSIYITVAVGLVLAWVSCLAGPAWFFPFPVPQPRTFKLTPFVMRFPVALSGSLTIPAMYFLARQMLDRRTALVAALFTACSAFMLFYSRDAKMYADVWLCECLFLACLLWWFRKGGSTRFLCWIACGCAMVGLHASSLAAVPVAVIMLLTQRNVRYTTGILFGAGLAVMCSGLLGYVMKFNKWVDRAEVDVVDTSGIGWVDKFYNGDRKGPDLALYATSTFLNGWEWPRDDYLDKLKPYDPDETPFGPKKSTFVEEHREKPIREALLVGPQTAFEMSALIVALGILPWPKRVRSPELSADPPGDARWRAYLWIGLWVMTIGYGFYAVSVKDFSPPGQWRDWAVWYLTPAGAAGVVGPVVAGVAIAASRRMWWPGLQRFAVSCLIFTAICFVVWVMYKVLTPMARAAEEADNPWPMVWLPRYMGVIWLAFGMAVAALLMRLPTRPFRIAAVTFLMLVNLGIFAMRMSLGTEPPIDKLAADVWATQDPKSTTRCYNEIGRGDIAVAGTDLTTDNSGRVDGITVAGGRYYLQMLADRSPMSPRYFDGSLGDFVPAKNRYNLRDFQSAGMVEQDVQRSPQLKTIILWTRVFPYGNPTRPPTSVDGEQYRFGKKWRLTEQQTYVIRIPWEWRQRWTWVRSVYTRADK